MLEIKLKNNNQNGKTAVDAGIFTAVSYLAELSWNEWIMGWETEGVLNNLETRPHRKGRALQ